MKVWPLAGLVVVQFILLLAHTFLERTVTFFWYGMSPFTAAGLRLALLVLAFTFVPAALLSFRFAHPLLRIFYAAAVLWLGLLNYLFLAALLAWPLWLILDLAGLRDPHLRPWLLAALVAAALLVTAHGILNARVIRVRRHTVRLPNLPESWRGRRAVLFSDVHLGSVLGVRFSRRLARMAAALHPDIVFIPGDLFDGVHADLDALLKPFAELNPPLGIYFSTGNHEEFGDATQYTRPIARAGIRVLDNERVTVDGMHIAGVNYRDSSYPVRARTLMDGLKLASGTPSILLHHVPSRLPIAEQAGVSLQLSGHTHGGQLFPYTWITRRVFGAYTSGLHRFGDMQVYTSAGVGTWGPPMRVGTQPEIVELDFE